MPCRIENDSRTREKNQKSIVSSFSKEKKFKLCLTIIVQYLSLKREAWSLIAFFGPPIHDREGSKNGGPAINYFHRNEFAFSSVFVAIIPPTKCQIWKKYNWIFLKLNQFLGIALRRKICCFVLILIYGCLGWSANERQRRHRYLRDNPEIYTFTDQGHPTTECFQIRQKGLRWFSLCFGSLFG